LITRGTVGGIFVTQTICDSCGGSGTHKWRVGERIQTLLAFVCAVTINTILVVWTLGEGDCDQAEKGDDVLHLFRFI
jgi:hypothetical protein